MMAGEMASIVPSRINMVIKRKKNHRSIKNYRQRQPPIQYLVLRLG
ncbi:unnamed protein product, partial [Musa textilis]